ncbi:MAG: CHAT domain-containing protein, partial [Bacteroidales bacterium]
MSKNLASVCFRFFLLLPLLVFWSCQNNTGYAPVSKSGSNLALADQYKTQGNYDSAIIFFKESMQANLLAKQDADWVRSVSGLIDCLRLTGKYDEATEIAITSIALSLPKLDTTGNLYTILLNKKAMLFADIKEFDKSMAIYSRNIAVYKLQSGKPDTCLALAYNGRGTVYLMQKKYKEALADYFSAKETYQKCGHTKSLNYTSSLQNIGIAYSYMEQYENSVDYFNQCLEINNEIFGADDFKQAALYLNIGRLYQIMRNDPKAIDFMNRAEKLYVSNKQSNSLTAGFLYLNMGVVYIYTADYEKAQGYLDKSLEIITEKAPNNLAERQTVYLNMAVIAEKKGQYSMAKEYYLKGLSLGETLPNSIKVLRGLASLSFNMDDEAGCDAYFKKALLQSNEGSKNELSETALTYMRYGDFLSATGNQQALVYLNKSLELYKQTFGEINIDVSTAYYYIGLYYYRAKHYGEAIKYFQSSLVSGFPGFTSSNFSDNPEIQKANLTDNLLNPLSAKATALLLLYQNDTSKIEYLENSAACFDVSVKMAEMLRSTYQEEDSKLFFSGNETNTFTNALLSQVQLYHKTKSKDALEQAFRLSEKGKSAILLSQLRDKEAKNIGKIPQKLLEEDANLKSEIYSLNQQIHTQEISENPDQTKIQAWKSRIFDLGRKQDELIKSIEKGYPAYYSLKYDNSVISISSIQKKLAKNQAIIEYSLSDSVLNIFAITQTSKQLVTKIIDSSFYSNLQMLRQQVSGKSFNNYAGSDFTMFIKASHDLYITLLLPIRPTVKGKELIIVPDGELGYFSFDALLTSMPDTAKHSYRKLPYLIKESALSYAPSATTYFNELSAKDNKNNGKILAFAPDYGPQNVVLDWKNEHGELLRTKLAELDNSQEEVKSLEKDFNVKGFIGKTATETMFKKLSPDYRVLHLAMHTIIDNENPLYSKLIFYSTEGDTRDDGMLEASELINMDLHAEMAVLSACNTGSGKLRKGEGIMSLSRDFFYAG